MSRILLFFAAISISLVGAVAIVSPAKATTPVEYSCDTYPQGDALRLEVVGSATIHVATCNYVAADANDDVIIREFTRPDLRTMTFTVGESGFTSAQTLYFEGDNGHFSLELTPRVQPVETTPTANPGDGGTNLPPAARDVGEVADSGETLAMTGYSPSLAIFLTSLAALSFLAGTALTTFSTRTRSKE